MNNKKATKRALLTSIMALVMCVVMLVGTTFAWFTDTASTGVNKIVAGNLKVDLEYAKAWDGAGARVPAAGFSRSRECLPCLSPYATPVASSAVTATRGAPAASESTPRITPPRRLNMSATSFRSSSA